MTSPTAETRRLIRRFTPVLGFLLLVVLFAGGTHHHTDGPHHVCAVCAAGHSPAIVADITAPLAAPASPARDLHAPNPRAPRPVRLETASSRAPPLA